MSDKGGLQLIPETRKRIEVSVPGENKMIYVGLGLIFVVALIYGGFFFYNSQLETTVDELNAKIDDQEKTRVKSEEEALISLSKQLSLVSALLDSHIIPTKAIEKIQSLVQPQVTISNLSLETSSEVLRFGGTAPNFTVIARQIAALLADDSVKDAIPGVLRNTKDFVEFSIDVKLNGAKFFK
jgi:hypothetical protein